MKRVIASLLLTLLLVSTLQAQQPALDTEQLADKALRITVGVEVTGSTDVSAVPFSTEQYNGQQFAGTPTTGIYTTQARRFLGENLAPAPQVQVASGTIVGDGSLVVTAAIQS